MASGDSLAFFHPWAIEPPVSLPATVGRLNDRPLLWFDGVADWEAQWTGVMPSAYQGGGVTVHVFVALVSATSGNVYFQGAFEKTIPGTTGLGSDDYAAFQGAGGVAPGTAGRMIDIEIPFTDGAQMDSVVAGDLFRFRLRRDADGTAGTDDITTTASVYGVYIEET